MVGWLEEMLIDAGVSMLSKAGDLLSAPVGNEYLGKTLSSAMSGVYAFAVQIQNTVTSPVGYSLLGFFMLAALYDTAQRSPDMSGTKLLEKIGMTMVSFILLKVTMDHAALLMEGLFSFFNWINEGIISASSLGTAATSTTGTSWAESLKGSVKTSEAFMFFMMCAIAWLCSFVGMLAANVVLTVLWIELYLMLSYAPIPLATMASDKFGEIGKSFLKQFAATCLQGGVVVFFLKVFSILFQSVPERLSEAAASSDIVGVVASTVVFAVVMIISIAGSAGASKRIVGAA